MHSSQVRYPLTNTVLATAFIKQNARAVLGNSAGVLTSEYALSHADTIRVLVDHFTTLHPRGRGVTGNALFAQFYAACRTIKIEQSTPSRFKRSATRYKLSPAAQKVLRTFTGADHIITREKGEITSRTRSVYGTLIEQGIINGYFTVSERGGSLVLSEAWLTDYGVRVRDTMIATQEREDQAARRESWFSDRVPMPMRVLNFHLAHVHSLRSEIEKAKLHKVGNYWITAKEKELAFHVEACEVLRDFAGA